MRIVQAFAVASTLACLGAASPVALDASTGTGVAVDSSAVGSGMEISITPKAVTAKVSSQQSKLETLRKFKLKKSKKDKSAAASTTAGTTSSQLTHFEKVAYTIPLVIGNQTMDVLFDTGSSDLWVFSDTVNRSPTGVTTYVPGANATLLDGYSFSIKYAGGGAAKGVVYADTCAVGAATVTNQAVEAATSINKSAQQSFANTDGIVGAAFSNINTVQPVEQNTVFTNLLPSLASPVFTTALVGKQNASSIDLGFIDSSKYKGDITYVDVDNASGFWKFDVGNYTVGKTTYGAVGKAIADTGTTLLYMPNAIVSQYYSAVSGAGYESDMDAWIFPCSSKLPPLRMEIGGTTFTVPPALLNQQDLGDGYCYGGLQDLGGGAAIFGDVFLRAVFTVWDQSSTPRIGFAKRNY